MGTFATDAMPLSLLLLAFSAWTAAQTPARFISYHAAADFPLTADPAAPQWKDIRGIVAGNGRQGEPVPGPATEIRSRWTEKYLYLLYTCPYEELYLHPNPQVDRDTDGLWDWDVAEAFIGSDFADIRRYKEFELSPQGEWIDLDVHWKATSLDADMAWNSGWKVRARIDKARKTWYGEMQIPMASIDSRRPVKGLEMRINLYHIQGPPAHRNFIAWQPTHSESFHVPEAFGRLVLK
jgi:Carbohydrate family 9 binding domain-like